MMSISDDWLTKPRMSTITTANPASFSLPPAA